MNEVKTTQIPGQPTAKVLRASEPGKWGETYIYDLLTNIPGMQEVGNKQTIKFQNGFVIEKGVNGTDDLSVLTTLIDRLKMFQKHEQTTSRELSIALTHLETAQLWLQIRPLPVPPPKKGE